MALKAHTKRSRTPTRPGPAQLQPDNGTLGKPKPPAQIAQGDQMQRRPPRNAMPDPERPKLHRVQEGRADAMEALGLPDIAPPPHTKLVKALEASEATDPTTSLAQRLEAVQNDLLLAKARISADLALEQYSASFNENAEINGALAPQKHTNGKCSDHSDDELVDLLTRGYLQIEVARYWHVPIETLFDYINASPGRLARALKARHAAAQACDVKALEVLRMATPETANKARGVAVHLQWRARMLSPEYQDKQRVTVDGGLTVTMEKPDRPAITTLIAEALQPFTPAPKMIDVEDPD